MRKSYCFAVLIIPLFLAACGGSAHNWIVDSMPELPAGVEDIQSGEWDNINAEGDYFLQNNPWNGDAALGDYEHSVFTGHNGEGDYFFGWRWYYDCENTYTVLAYPQVLRGKSPFIPAETWTPTPGFPYVIDGHSFHSSFDATLDIRPVNGQEVWNFTYEMWILFSGTDSADYDRSDIKCEIMIWLDNRNSILPYWIGEPADTVTVNGYTFDYYYLEEQPDGSGPDGHHPFCAFECRTPVHSSADFDLTPFISYLVSDGTITVDDYVATIELGNEVYICAGQTVLNEYSVTVY